MFIQLTLFLNVFYFTCESHLMGQTIVEMMLHCFKLKYRHIIHKIYMIMYRNIAEV